MTETEPNLTLEDACRLSWIARRRGGSSLSRTTLFRWIRDGRRVGKQVIHLQATKQGATWCTRESWLQRFFDELARAELEGAGVTTTDIEADDAEQLAAQQYFR